MKQAHNTEIDLLLQRHARRAGAGTPTGHGSAGSDSGSEAPDAGASPHLDADEMNAYAEGALLPQTRSRYLAHLADCDACRKIVTDLTLASNVAGETSQRDLQPQASPSRSWWNAIAGLFAPPMLRYAIPALLLFGVMVVAIVAIRNRKEDQFVAQNEQQPVQTTATTPNEGTPAPSVQATPGESAGPAPPPATSGTIAPGTIPPEAPLTDQPQGKASQANANAAESSPALKQVPPPPVSTVAPTDSPGRDEDRNSGQIYGNPSKAGPPPAEVTTAAPVAGVEEKEDAKREQQAAQQRKAPAASTRSEAAAGGRNKDTEATKDASLAAKSTAEQNEAPPVASKSSTRRRSATPGASGDGGRLNDNAGGSTETRSVGGRRFRRQGSAWVDTAYNSSRSTINVARGSDQYRALVADEPRIGSIAEQLGGEVIVVWKGRAYRIR
jgi:hypothetical protein